MKKVYVILIMLVVAFAIFAIGKGSYETITDTNSFQFLGGDTAETEALDTSYYEFAPKYPQYRFGRVFYQADVTLGGMSNCTIFVDLQQGTGTQEGYWETLKTMVITQDSNMTTTGWDLYYTFLADSIFPYLRLRSRAHTHDSDSGATNEEKIDSIYTNESTITILVRE